VRRTQRALYIPPETSDRAGNLRLGDKLSAPYFPGQSHDKKLQQNEFEDVSPWATNYQNPKEISIVNYLCLTPFPQG
jgi:hypothetical protein